jgi:hypothetical protein
MAERLSYRPIPKQTLDQYAAPLRPVIEAEHRKAAAEKSNYVLPQPSAELNKTAIQHKNMLKVNRKAIMEDRKGFVEKYTGSEQEVLIKLSDGLIAAVAASELHEVFKNDTVDIPSLQEKILEFDTDFGESFKQSEVRKHYEQMIKVVALVNHNRALVKGQEPNHIDVANLPDFNFSDGQWRVGLVNMLWYTRDVYGETMTGKPGMRLLDVMARLKQSDNEFMYVDTRNGREITRNENGDYIARNYKTNAWEIVDKANIGFGYFHLNSGKKDTTMDQKIVVNVKGPDGKTMYVKRSRLRKGSVNDRSLDAPGDIVDAKEVVEPYNYGRTPAEKIYPRHLDPDNISEIELIAQRVADALGEMITLSPDETEMMVRKSRGDLRYYGIPNTPKQDKVNQWATHHPVIQKVHNTMHALSQESIDSLPDPLMKLFQKSSPKKVKLNSGKEVTLNIDKKGNWAMLLGLGWDEIAKLTRADMFDLAVNHAQVIGAKMHIDRMNQANDVISETIETIKKMPFYGAAEAYISYAGGKIGKYSKPWMDKIELFLNVTKTVSPREVEVLQQSSDVGEGIKKTTEAMRKFLAWHEFIAWKVSPLFIENLEWVKYYKPEYRGRQIANELFATDEAVINDPIVGAKVWKETVVNNLYGAKYSNFTGGVVFEQWLKSFKRFQEGEKGQGIVDSKGVTRAIKFTEVLQYLGMKMETDKVDFVTKDGSKIKRRRLKMLTTSINDPAWRAYTEDPSHGVDPRVAASLHEFFNTGPNPIIPKRNTALFGQILPPYFDVTDLFRTKYAAIDWFLENKYPNRRWGGQSLAKFQIRVNEQGSINEHGSEDVVGGLISKSWDKMKYRWGYVPGREPLNIWEASLRMSSESRLEIAPDTKYLESKLIKTVRVKDGLDEQGRQKYKPLEVYRVGNSTFRDPVLARLNVDNYLGYATLETLRNISRKDGLSVESIEYGSGDFVPKRGAGSGVTRPPIDLAKRALHFKVPIRSREHSVEFQKRIIEEDVAARLGIDPHTTNKTEQKILRAHTELEWDAKNATKDVASPTDTFFMYFELFQAEKITANEFMSLCNMAGCNMILGFDSLNTMHIKAGQGAAFVESMKRLGLPDTFLDGMLKQDVEKANKTYQFAAQLVGSYFVGKNTFILSEAMGEAAKASTTTVKSLLRNARLPAIVTAPIVVGSISLADPILRNIGIQDPWILGAASFGLPAVSMALGTTWAALQTYLIKSTSTIHGNISNILHPNEYVPDWFQSKTSIRSSLRAHEAGCAVWNGTADSVVTDVDINKGGNLYKLLAQLYDISWSTEHKVPAPAV